MVYDAINVEPGIYLDGWFGVRIEDYFLVNQEGNEFPSEDLPRDLDCFMIEEDDYPSNMSHAQSDLDPEILGNSIPIHIGFAQLLIISGIAAVIVSSRED